MTRPRFVVRITMGKRTAIANPSPLGLGAVVLDSHNAYRIEGEFHSETRDGRGYIGHVGAMSKANALAARLNIEYP